MTAAVYSLHSSYLMKTFYISAEDKYKITKKVEELHQKAKTIFPNLGNWTRPSWDAKVVGTTGGLAYLLRNRISLNAGLFNRNKDEFYNNVIPHEIAHLIAYMLYKDRGHGEAWRNTMQKLGYSPSRCHSMDVKEVKRTVTLQRWVYKCGCRENNMHYLPEARHLELKHGKVGKDGKRIEQNQRCSKCRGLLISQNSKTTIKK